MTASRTDSAQEHIDALAWQVVTLRSQRDRATEKADAALDDTAHLRRELERITRNLRGCSDGEVTLATIADELQALVDDTARPTRRRSAT